MVPRMILAIGVVAGVVAATVPVESLARGGFVGFRTRASFQRPSVPVFHRPIASRPIHARPAAAGLDARPAVNPIHHASVPGLRSLAFRHHHRFRRDTFYSGYAYPGAYLGSEDPSTINDDTPSYDPGSACRAQDYVVPSSSGERRSVRVLRC